MTIQRRCSEVAVVSTGCLVVALCETSCQSDNHAYSLFTSTLCIVLVFLEYALNGVHAALERLHAGTEREADEVVARGSVIRGDILTHLLEEVTPVRRVDVEEESWNADTFLLEEFFKEREAVVEWCGER